MPLHPRLPGGSARRAETAAAAAATPCAAAAGLSREATPHVAAAGLTANVSANAPDDLRITFDAAIAYRDLFAAPAAALHLLQAEEAVMEIKAAGPFPLWLVQALDACRAYPTSFSKYGEAYRACMSVGTTIRPVPAPCGAPEPMRKPVVLRRFHAPRHAAIRC